MTPGDDATLSLEPKDGGKFVKTRHVHLEKCPDFPLARFDSTPIVCQSALSGALSVKGRFSATLKTLGLTESCLDHQEHEGGQKNATSFIYFPHTVVKVT